MHTPLDINRENLTIMGVEFPDLKSLESAPNAIGSNMFNGFKPTAELVHLYIDLKNKLISDSDLLAKLYLLYGK
jgi:putative transcriptional regulator